LFLFVLFSNAADALPQTKAVFLDQAESAVMEYFTSKSGKRVVVTLSDSAMHNRTTTLSLLPSAVSEIVWRNTSTVLTDINHHVRNTERDSNRVNGERGLFRERHYWSRIRKGFRSAAPTAPLSSDQSLTRTHTHTATDTLQSL
jgi:hypothetical protein